MDHGAEEFERIQQAAALMMFLSPGTTTGLAYEVQGTPVSEFEFFFYFFWFPSVGHSFDKVRLEPCTEKRKVHLRVLPTGIEH